MDVTGSESNDGRRGPWVALVVAVIVAGAALGALVVLVLVGPDSSSAAVTLTPADAPGADPFTDSVATGPIAVFSGNVSAVNATFRQGLSTSSNTGSLVASGTAPGLYGGSGDTHVCDPAKLVSFLENHQDKASAWARALGISPKRIADYVATLTPVVLMADTLVTNHGYRDGDATAFPAVLQAGTAVMVDSTGTPRVKCNCGNPLGPPEAIDLSSASFRGTRWVGYAPAQVAVVNPGRRTSQLTLINITTGATFTQAVGGSGGQWVATETDVDGAQTAVLTSLDGASWTAGQTISNESVGGIAWGDGKWIGVSNVDQGQGTHVLESSDLRTWKQVADLKDVLSHIAYGDGRWVATGLHWTPGLLATSISHSTPVVYTSKDGRIWREGASAELQGGSNGFEPPVAYGDGRFVTVGLTESFATGGFDAIVQSSTDGVHWAPTGGKPVLNGPVSIAFGAGTWVLANSSTTRPILTSRDTVSWNPSLFNGATPPSVVAFGDGRFLAAVGFRAITDIVSSPDGTTWTTTGSATGAGFTALAFGGSASSTPAPPSTESADKGTPCTRAALQDVFSHEPDDDMDRAILNSKDELHCADGWAVIHYGNQGRYPLAVFRVSGGAWQVQPGPSSAADLGEGESESGGIYCTDPSFPAALRRVVCT